MALGCDKKVHIRSTSLKEHRGEEGIITHDCGDGYFVVSFPATNCRHEYHARDLILSEEAEGATLTISKDLVSLNSLTSRGTSSKVSLKTFLDELRRRMSQGTSATPILPPGVVQYERIGDYEGVILEDPPGIREIRWSDSDDGGSVYNYEKYRCAFPYVYLGFSLVKGRIRGYDSYFLVAYRNSPVTSKDDILHPTNLKNTDRYKICFHPELDAKDIYEAAGHIREAFWSHTFNSNLGGGNYRYNAGVTTGNIKEWQEKSQRNWLFVLQVNWPAGNLTVSGMMNLLRHGAGSRGRQLENFTDLTDLFWQIPEANKKEKQGEDPWLG